MRDEFYFFDQAFSGVLSDLTVQRIAVVELAYVADNIALPALNGKGLLVDGVVRGGWVGLLVTVGCEKEVGAAQWQTAVFE